MKPWYGHVLVNLPYPGKRGVAKLPSVFPMHVVSKKVSEVVASSRGSNEYQ